MSYQIFYNATGSVYRKPRKKYSLPILLAGAVLLTGITLRIVWPDKTEKAIKLLFPWTEQSVVQAYGRMTDSIHMGESVKDAVAVFCKDIICHGEP